LRYKTQLRFIDYKIKLYGPISVVENEMEAIKLANDYPHKIIYNNTWAILDSPHTACVVWDVQNTSVRRIFNKEEFSRQQRDNSDVENNRNDTSITIQE
jgi:hypothetical protein